MDFFDQVTREAKKAGDFIADKAVKTKDYAVATWNAAELRNKIEALYKKIGKAVYAAHTTEAETAEEIEQYIQEISFLKDALAEKEQVKQSIFSQKVCTACGKGVNKNHVFCPYCGKDLK